MVNEYEIKTGIELDGKFYELTQKYKEIPEEKFNSLYVKLDSSGKDNCCICLAESEGKLDEYRRKEVKH